MVSLRSHGCARIVSAVLAKLVSDKYGKACSGIVGKGAAALALRVLVWYADAVIVLAVWERIVADWRGESLNV